MTVYRPVALVADLNALSSINTQGYQTSDAFATEVALHFSPFLALATHKKGVSHATQGRNTPTKSTKRRLPPPLCAWLFSVKRSYATATGSLLRLRFGFFAFVTTSSALAIISASAGASPLACLSCSIASFAFGVIKGITTT
jgi:hypothetical protein